MKKRVLVVDDSLYMRSMISAMLKKGGYEVVGEAADGKSAVQNACELKPDLITLDNVLPDSMGMDLVPIMRQRNVDAKVLIVSAVGQQTMVDKGKQLGASDYIVKPFEEQVLLSKIGEILD